MAVESLPLPIGTSLPVLPALPTRAQAERFRAVIAIAAASVFVAGVGVAYVEAQVTNVVDTSAEAAAGTLSESVTEAVPAAAVPVAPLSSDAGPLRRNGSGTASDVAEPALGPISTPSYERSSSSYRQSVHKATTPATSSKSTTRSRSASASTSASSSSASSSSASSSSATRTSASSSATRSSTKGATSYAVRTGDDFGAVAARFGVSSTRIAALNPGIDSSELSIGQTLRVR